MSFIGNERKFPIKDLTGKPEDDSRLIREHFERIKGFAPRQEPHYEQYAGSMPSGTAWTTITPTNPPTTAVGAIISWNLFIANQVNLEYRMDSSDSNAKPIGVTQAGAGAFVNATVFFSGPDAQTFDIRYAAGPGSITTSTLYIVGWVY